MNKNIYISETEDSLACNCLSFRRCRET